MSGRRSHVRFAVVQPPEGVFRVMRDVVVQQRAGNQELVAISREPGFLGEAVVLEFPDGEAGDRVQARVIDSQPVVLGGVVRHRLRLEAMSSTAKP